MPTRRIFDLVVITSLLLWPAKATVRAWGHRQLAVRQPGSILHGTGEVIVTIL